MKRPTNNPLLWQAVVILLPVFVLAGLGAFYLRQDRILVRHEAEERARVLAEDVLNQVWQRLTSPEGMAHDPGFRVDNAGNLLDPPPFERTPVPQPLNFELLTP